MPTLDLPFIRSQFPALDQTWTFMDNAGGSQTLKQVADRIHDYLLHSNVQHGASYAVSQEAGERVQAATKAMATLVNAADPREVVMGPSATALFRILALSLRKGWQAGDRIIVTNTDHEANVSPWTDLAQSGIDVQVWHCHPETLRLELSDLEPLLNERTRLVALTHCSNILGTLNPIQDIAKVVHEAGALLCVDGVAYAPHRLVDVQALDVDFYVFSCYKVYGPHYGLLYGRWELLRALPRFNHYFIDGDQVPYKFQPGNVNFELAYGAAGLVDYLSQVARHHGGEALPDLRAELVAAFDLFAEHEAQLADRLLTYLQSKPKVRIIGEQEADPSVRVPTISFVVEGVASDAVVAAVDPHFIGIRYGDFYAKKLIESLGLIPQNGVVRVSLVHYNSLEEVGQLVKVLDTSGLLD